MVCRKTVVRFAKGLLFSGSSDSNESACIAGDLGLIPGLGGSPGGAWQATVRGVTKSRT